MVEIAYLGVHIDISRSCHREGQNGLLCFPHLKFSCHHHAAHRLDSGLELARRVSCGLLPFSGSSASAMEERTKAHHEVEAAMVKVRIMPSSLDQL
jgi:hypothetical protein